MENNNLSLNTAETLQFIESMINRAKDNFSENGHLYLLWGWIVAVCSFGHFIMWHYQLVSRPYWIWLLTWLAFLYQVFHLRRRKGLRPVKTYTDEILSYVWVCFVLLMLVTAIVATRMSSAKMMYPLFLVLYGMPTFLSGRILRFRWLTYGGVSCWILAIAATSMEMKFQLLCITAAVILAWIVPGYLLQAKFKKEKFYARAR